MWEFDQLSSFRSGFRVLTVSQLNFSISMPLVELVKLNNFENIFKSWKRWKSENWFNGQKEIRSRSVAVDKIFLIQHFFYFYERNWIFAINSNFLIPIFMHPDGVNFWFSNLFDQTEFTLHSLFLRSTTRSWKYIGIRKSKFVAQFLLAELLN